MSQVPECQKVMYQFDLGVAIRGQILGFVCDKRQEFENRGYLQKLGISTVSKMHVRLFMRQNGHDTHVDGIVRN